MLTVSVFPPWKRYLWVFSTTPISPEQSPSPCHVNDVTPTPVPEPPLMFPPPEPQLHEGLPVLPVTMPRLPSWLQASGHLIFTLPVPAFPCIELREDERVADA